MNDKIINVYSKIDAKTFKNFAYFENMHRQRRWRFPVLFSSIMLVFAIACFALSYKANQAVMLGCVLLVIGFGLPAIYFFNFYLSILRQIKKLDLERPHFNYSLALSKSNGVDISAGSERVRLKWEQLYCAYRSNNCIYLYVNATRAFLMPDEQIEGGADILWELMIQAMPKEKLFDLRKKTSPV